MVDVWGGLERHRLPEANLDGVTGWTSTVDGDHPYDSPAVASGVGDVRLGTDQCLSADDDDAFIVRACCVRGEFLVERRGGLCPDDCEVPVAEFKNVRT